MAENQKLASDDELILVLAGGATVAEAAERAGVGEAAIYGRLKDAEFRRAVSETRFLAFDATVGKLASLAPKAVSSLERLANHGTPTVALRAAKTILELGPRLLAFTQLEPRIAALEAEERKPRGKSGEADALNKLRRGAGATPAQLEARLARLETQRTERDADGQSVSETAEKGTAAHEADGMAQPPAPREANSGANAPGKPKQTGTKPPVAENVSKSEIRWR